MDKDTKRIIFIFGVVFGILGIVLSVLTKDPLAVLGVYCIAFAAIFFVYGVIVLADKIFP